MDFLKSGDLLVTGWFGGNAVYKVSPDLSSVSTLISDATLASHGISGDAGIAVSKDGSFYVCTDNANYSQAAVISHYDASGNFLDNISDSHFTGGFDIKIGPDGNLYATNTTSFGSTPGCILRFDTTTDTFMDVFVTNTGGNGPEALFFDSICAVSEPSSLAFVIACLGSVALVRKKRAIR